jgi:hypothetical protein
VVGSPDTPLHANTFAGFATRDNIRTVTEFFQAQPFARLGAIISFRTALADELGPVPTIAKVLQAIAAWTAFKRAGSTRCFATVCPRGSSEGGADKQTD